MLKGLLIGLVTVVLGIVGYAAMQPAQFEIARSTTIAAPPERVFPHIDDLKKWQEWSPWAKLDPAAKTSFEGPAAGKGAIFNWAGNSKVGAGRMTILESQPTEHVNLQVHFTDPMPGAIASDFRLAPAAGGTTVTWTSSGENSLLGRIMCLFVNMDRAMGGAMEEGLANLKKAAETG